MEPSQPSPVDSVRSSPMDEVEEIKPSMRSNISLEARSSSSEHWLLETVRDGTKLASHTVDPISTEETEKLFKTDEGEALAILKVKVVEVRGLLNWVFIGLFVAAFAKLCIAFGAIVEGAIICGDYLERGRNFRFWSATTAAAQLEKTYMTNQLLRDARDSLGLSPDQWDNEVFLSHSGKQKIFVRQLHRDLTREHVSCFFDEDYKSLPLAHKFPPLIFKAAETCRIAVLVLSHEFIRSKWPMLELSAFISAINSGKNVNLKLLPIFFMISPKELSHITKDCPEWQKLKVSNDTRYEWQDALKEVRSINGLHFGKDENEVDFRDKIVKAICCLLKRINPESPLQLLDFKPVGIEEQVEEVKRMLDMEGTQSTSAVLVCGVGGVGKSTLAASVVQSLDWFSTDFKFCRVAIDEKTMDKTSHIIKLQKDIIDDLGGGKVELRDTHEGRHKIREALKKKCCLLFIDNVADKDYIGDLLPKDLSSGEQEAKLRIIITSREKNVKAELNIFWKEYEVKGLSDMASKSLLLETILQSQVVKDIDMDEEHMINEVAAACKGVPLLLSVFGKHLRMERDNDSYQEVLDVLREGDLDSYRDEDLGTKLLFVYDKIKDVEFKEAFLEICIYFHGWEWNLVADIVDVRTLRDLQRRMLVSKSGSDKVIVHDILRLMGMKKGRFTRFSNYKEFSDALEDNLDGLENVKGISLVSDNGLITIQSTQLEAMHLSLRVLILGDWVKLDGPACHRAFRNLRYLRVGDINVFPFKDPSKLDKLRVFENRSKPGMNLSHLPSSLKRISHEVPDVECDEFAKLPFQNLSSLKTFIVKTEKSVQLPQELQLAASLVYLDLRKCKNLPKDVSHLTALEFLSLNRSDLKCLPQGFGKLKKLKHLTMNFCSKLDFLSEELGMLSSLEVLSIDYCENLRGLPDSLGGLVSLKKLDFRQSINLQLLPESFGDLPIHKLELSSLVCLQELPNSIGNMSLLKDLSLESCHSLMSLPDSFVQLKIETLRIINCTKLSILPQHFGRLRCLKHMSVEDCHLLKELPLGFGALPVLKIFRLSSCKSFVTLPPDFPELTDLEELNLQSLPLISRFPDGFGKVKRLRCLDIVDCFHLKTLSDDFEDMVTLERLVIRNCPELDGLMTDKILKLQHCYMADIRGSTKLLEKWKHMKSKVEHPILVLGGASRYKESRRSIRVALLHGKCMEVNNLTHQLMERSSLGLEEDTSATVALIMLPIHMQSHQHQTLQLFVEMAKETAMTNGSGKLQIVCAIKYASTVQMPKPTNTEERAEDGIRKILLSLPKGSCVIPSAESKRIKILTLCCHCYSRPDSKLSFFMANVGLDIEGRQLFWDFKFTHEDKISPPPEISKPENKHNNNFKNFIKSIYSTESKSVAGESKTREFMEVLKSSGIHYLLIHNHNNTSKVLVDDLHGKTIGLIICNLKILVSIKLQTIYKDLQEKDSNFIAIWIPTVSHGYGHGTYTRLIQCMPWATFPNPQLVNVNILNPYFFVLDKEGHIADKHAWESLLAWGVNHNPFTPHTIHESFLMESESCLEFLLQGMNIVGRKTMKTKMTFLCVERPDEWCRMNCKLEELAEINGNFEVLTVEKLYEDSIQYAGWPSLSSLDMVMFWYRCEYLARDEVYKLNKESNIMMERLHGLAKLLCPSSGKLEFVDDRLTKNAIHSHESLILVDNNGLVTRGGHELVDMICQSADEILKKEGMTMRMVKDELMKSLSRGECSPIVKTFFRDEIDNLPQHPQHRISYSRKGESKQYICDVCDVGFCRKSAGWNGQRSYSCDECDWDMCGRCWLTFAKQEVEQLLYAKN